MAKDCTAIKRLYEEYQKNPGLEVENENNEDGLKLMYKIADKIGLKDLAKDKVKEKIYDVARKKVFSKVFSAGTAKIVLPEMAQTALKVGGMAVGVVVGVALDSEVANAPGSEMYYETMRSLLNASCSGASKAYLDKLYKSLEYARDTLTIEKDYGIKSGCYQMIHDLTLEIKRVYVDKDPQLKAR